MFLFILQIEYIFIWNIKMQKILKVKINILSTTKEIPTA